MGQEQSKGEMLGMVTQDSKAHIRRVDCPLIYVIPGGMRFTISPFYRAEEEAQVHSIKGI